MKIGLMGGSFDPVHCGHIGAARDAMNQHNLDRVIFLPAAETPRKSENTLTAGHHRLAMLQTAIARLPDFEVSDFEVSRGGVSFSINTVRHFRRQFPNDDLFWIIGADQVPFLDQWRNIEELGQLVQFIYLARPGYEIRALPNTPGLAVHQCEGHFHDISSRDLRDDLRTGNAVDGLIQPEVIVYIGQRKLYQ